MKTLLMVICLIFVPAYGNSQGTALYNELGQLRCDTSYRIAPELLNTVKNIERSMHRIYRKIEYPWQAAENKIGAFVIAKIHVDNERLYVYCKIDKCSDPAFEQPVVNAVHENQLFILQITKDLDNFIFYLPFKFEVETSPILEDMKEHEAVRIKTHCLEPVSVPL